MGRLIGRCFVIYGGRYFVIYGGRYFIIYEEEFFIIYEEDYTSFMIKILFPEIEMDPFLGGWWWWRW